MTRAIIESITRWEPRIKTLSVTYSVQGQENAPTVPAGLCFTIIWQLIGGELIETTDLLIGFGGADIQITVLGIESGEAVLTQNENYIEI
jgi:hypothetical protein